MSDDVQDVTTEETEAAEAAADDTATAEAAVEERAAEEEPVAEAEVAEAPVAEEVPAEEPVAEEPLAEAEAADEPVAEEAPAAVSEAFGPVRVARVYVCERGHRTATLWGAPDVCQARPLRSGPVCGLPLYHITELPDQVQKALNPLKASKKASKKK